MAVHIYGLTVDIDPVLEIARKYNLRVIEDAAEVIGQTYKDKPCGSFGDISTFSFYPNKHITTGEGGMVMVNNDELAEKCKELRNLSFGKIERFKHEEKGWNFRMSNLQAAVGVAQLERLSQSIKKKKKIGEYYRNYLKDNENFLLPLPKTDYCENIYWVFGLVSNNKTRDAKWWIKQLSEKKIGTRPFFYPMHRQPCIDQKKRGKIKLPISEKLSKYGFYIPSGLLLNEEKLKVITKLINSL